MRLKEKPLCRTDVKEDLNKYVVFVYSEMKSSFLCSLLFIGLSKLSKSFS